MWDGADDVPNGGITAPLLRPLQGHRVPAHAAGSGVCMHVTVHTCIIHMHSAGTAGLSCPELHLLPQFPPIERGFPPHTHHRVLPMPWRGYVCMCVGGNPLLPHPQRCGKEC